ncbi:UNVERIFIED_CONTAM: hypothetical protein Sradi_3071900 [Sesamum radiatum]|uniref:Uncharacterized protein n=1 Tax=Sesamum radiatum TaxID=300843 RepID=A0AAW2RC44_SESRA
MASHHHLSHPSIARYCYYYCVAGRGGAGPGFHNDGTGRGGAGYGSKEIYPGRVSGPAGPVPDPPRCHL